MSSELAGRLRAESRQPALCFIQRFRFLAEGKPYLLRAVSGIVVKTGARHSGDADLLNQIFRERNIVVRSECRDIGHHVISAARTEAFESGGGEGRHQTIAPSLISFGKLRVVLGRET